MYIMSRCLPNQVLYHFGYLCFFLIYSYGYPELDREVYFTKWEKKVTELEKKCHFESV
jgi:hypothetical protein